MVPESDHRFDRQLAEWFSRRGGAWSGTAGELLASLKSSADASNTLAAISSAGLYSHLQSHTQELRSLGIEVILRNAVPRMVSLRPIADEASRRKPPASVSSTERKANDSLNLPSRATARKIHSPHSVETVSVKPVSVEPAPSQQGPVGGETPVEELPLGESASTDSQRAFLDGPREGFFLNTGEALFAMLEMRRQIREQGLDLEATVELVIRRAQEITRCSGTAVGFLPEEIGSPFRSGSVSSRTELAFDANLFQGSLLAGEAVPISDAQNHSVLGNKCRREGVRSLIIMPIFRGQDVAGAIEFFFPEARTFSAEDVMDLGLIAGVISESLGGSRNIGVKRAMTDRRLPAAAPPENSVPKLEPKTQSEPEIRGLAQPGHGKEETVAEAAVTAPKSSSPHGAPETLAAKLSSAPTQFWRVLRKTWSQ